MNTLARLERRLTLYTVALVASLVVCLIVIMVGKTLELRRNEQRVRAQVVAESLAASIGRALAYDIPLDRLSGIDAIFGVRLGEEPGIVRISLTDASENIVVEYPASTEPIDRLVAISARVRSKGNEAAATVTVYAAPTTLLDAMSFPVALGVIVIIVTVMIARRSVSYALKRGAEAREVALQVMQERVAAGDLTTVINEASPRSFDLRASWLTTRIRDLNERRLRLERLVASLLHTEPEFEERQRLSALVTETAVDIRFAISKPARERIYPLRSDLSWIIFLGSSAVWIALGASAAVSGVPLWYRPMLLALAATACVGGLQFGQHLASGASAKLVAALGLTVTTLASVVFAVARSVDAARDAGPWVAVAALGIGFGIFVRALAGLAFSYREPSPLIAAAMASERIPPAHVIRGLCVGWPLGIIGATVLGISWSLVVAGLVAGAAHVFLATLRVEQTRMFSGSSGRAHLLAASPREWLVFGFAFGIFMASSVTGDFPGLRVDTAVETLFALCGLVVGIAVAFFTARRLTVGTVVVLAATASWTITAGYFDAVPYPISLHVVTIGVLAFATAGYLIAIGAKRPVGIEVLPKAGAGSILGCVAYAAAMRMELPMDWLWLAEGMAWLWLAWPQLPAAGQR